MPENFSSLLEALDSEGRELARPVPAAEIENHGRIRRRRHWLTAATSAAAVCAIAAGIALSAGGRASSDPRPSAPSPTLTAGPTKGSAAATPAATPAASSASTPHASGTANRTGTSALLQPSEAVQPALFQWKLGQTRTVSQGNITPFLACGFDKPPTVHAQSEVFGSYAASFDGSTGSEAVYHYASAAAAQQDYDVLKAIPAGCKTSRMGVSISSGLAWQDTNDGAAMHMMLVKSGPDIAFWLYQYQGSTPYDTSDDQAALQRMADRLDGGTPAPDPITAPPANVIPGSAWLDLTQIPFGTADQSHGWYLMGAQQSGQGSVAPTDLCASAAFVVDGKDAVDVFRNYHGTPTSTPVYPGSNYLYSSAVQTIATFPSENRATAAFDTGRQVTQLTGCTFKDPSGEQTNRTIKVGATNPTGFSLLVNDKPGASYEHVYVVLKGTHVSTLMVNFEQGDTSTSGDAAVLATMEAQLP